MLKYGILWEICKNRIYKLTLNCRDISKKVKTAVQSIKKQGKYLSSYAPLGYQKDPKDKHKLIVEETGAVIVRRIFDLAREGIGSKKICKILNNEGILTPRNHWKSLNGIELKSGKWNPETVIFILKNRTYLGEIVQSMYDCARFRRTPPKRKAQEEWIITPNTHEPIVDAESFEFASKMIAARYIPVKTGEIQLFAGYVKCETCGYALGYSYSQGTPQYTCGTYRRHGRNYCSAHYIRKDVLEHIVLTDICKYAKLASNASDELARQLYVQSDDSNETRIKTLNSELVKSNTRNVELDGILKRLYEDNVSGKLSDDRFNKFLIDYEQEQSELQIKTNTIEKEIKDIKNNQRDTSSWIKLIRNYTKVKKLDRTILSELVDKITVGETKEVDGKKVMDITIHYRFVGAVVN